jgi:hypothetical protein
VGTLQAANPDPRHPGSIGCCDSVRSYELRTPVYFFKNSALRVTQKRVYASAGDRALLVYMIEAQKSTWRPRSRHPPIATAGAVGVTFRCHFDDLTVITSNPLPLCVFGLP